MLSSAKEEGDDLHECVYEVADDDSWGHDLGVRVLLLVEVPRAAHSEELSIVPSAV